MCKKWIYGIVASLLVFVTLGAGVAPAFAMPEATVMLTTASTTGTPLTLAADNCGVYMPQTPIGGSVTVKSVVERKFYFRDPGKWLVAKPSNVLVWSAACNFNVTPTSFDVRNSKVFVNLPQVYMQMALKNHKAVIYYLDHNMWRALTTFSVDGGTRAAAYAVGQGTYVLGINKK